MKLRIMPAKGAGVARRFLSLFRKKRDCLLCGKRVLRDNLLNGICIDCIGRGEKESWDLSKF